MACGVTGRAMSPEPHLRSISSMRLVTCPYQTVRNIYVTAFRLVPEKKYRLRNGSMGTEYDALFEAIQVWKNKLQEAEDMLEELHRRIEIADGRPPA